MTNSARAVAASGTIILNGKVGQKDIGTLCADCPARSRKPELHRSDADHGMFWAIVHRAFESWPERHSFCPADETELYGWLLVEAGYCVSGEIHDRDINAIRKSARTFMDLAGESDHEIHYMRLTPTRTGVRVTIPRSLSYKKAGKKKFEKARSDVYEVIESILGVPVETMKREAKEAA